MPACFQLFKKGETEASKMTDIDDAICKHLGLEPDKDMYVYSWFDSIGFMIATSDECKLGSPKLRERVLEWTEKDADWREKLLAILDFLEANYTSNSWYQVGR